MAWGSSPDFPRAIVHVDGDAFFASCEVAKNPRLRGKPVITGKERGIVSAATYEAKARGVVRGMRLFEALRACPDAVILPSDYETYSLFSQRMYAITRRYTPAVEEYGIDECFADITGLRRLHRMSYPQIALRIKAELERELNMTFSLGLGPTKVLAKLGSKWCKPSGFTPVPLLRVHEYLSRTPVGQVWGIGPGTAAYLDKLGVRTAQEFAQKDEAWVRLYLHKPQMELWRELRGETALPLVTEAKESYASISKTKTFTPPSRDYAFICAQLSKNIENACIKARRYNLAATEVSFFLKTQDFRYKGAHVELARPTGAPQEVLAAIARHVERVFVPGTLYRATGAVLGKLGEASAVQMDLFGASARESVLQKVFESVDWLAQKYGKHSVFLGSSMRAMTDAAHKGARGEMPARTQELFPGESARRRLAMPYLGEVA